MAGKKGKSGGYREGAKRPFKYGEPTKVMRIPISMVPAIEKMLDKLLEKRTPKCVVRPVVRN